MWKHSTFSVEKLNPKCKRHIRACQRMNYSVCVDALRRKTTVEQEGFFSRSTVMNPARNGRCQHPGRPAGIMLRAVVVSVIGMIVFKRCVVRGKVVLQGRRIAEGRHARQGVVSLIVKAWCHRRAASAGPENKRTQEPVRQVRRFLRPNRTLQLWPVLS